MNTYHEVKYLHSKLGKQHTIAYIQPDPKKLIREFKKALDKLETPKFAMTVGVSMVHPKDQFKKQTGRELAQLALDRLEFNVWLTDQNDHYQILLTKDGYKNRFNLDLALKLYKDSGKIRVVESELYEI